MYEICCGFLSFYASFYLFIFYFQDLSENHPGDRVSWLKIIIIIIIIIIIYLYLYHYLDIFVVLESRARN